MSCIPCAGPALRARNADLRMRSAPATEGDGSYYWVDITRPRPDRPHRWRGPELLRARVKPGEAATRPGVSAGCYLRGVSPHRPHVPALLAHSRPSAPDQQDGQYEPDYYDPEHGIVRYSASEAYSITWSARCGSDGGIVRPRALAVLRLITSSNLVGCSTGRSPSFAPFKILSTKCAACMKLARSDRRT